jgi:predicted RecB family nuclease
VISLPWSDHCADTWNAEDSLFNVANVSRAQVKNLETANIRTMEALASVQLTKPMQVIIRNPPSPNRPTRCD